MIILFYYIIFVCKMSFMEFKALDLDNKQKVLLDMLSVLTEDYSKFSMFSLWINGMDISKKFTVIWSIFDSVFKILWKETFDQLDIQKENQKNNVLFIKK